MNLINSSDELIVKMKTYSAVEIKLAMFKEFCRVNFNQSDYDDTFYKDLFESFMRVLDDLGIDWRE